MAALRAWQSWGMADPSSALTVAPHVPCSGQRMLEEFQTHLDTAKNKSVVALMTPSHLHTFTPSHPPRSAESEDRADRASRLLAQVKNGVDHLHEKLQHIKAVRVSPIAPPPPPPLTSCSLPPPAPHPHPQAPPCPGQRGAGAGAAEHSGGEAGGPGRGAGQQRPGHRPQRDGG